MDVPRARRIDVAGAASVTEADGERPEPNLDPLHRGNVERHRISRLPLEMGSGEDALFGLHRTSA